MYAEIFCLKLVKERNCSDIMYSLIWKVKFCLDVSASKFYSTILLKNPARYFVDIDKVIVNCICKGKTPRIVNAILKRTAKFKVSCNLILRLTTKLQYSRQWYWQNN